LYFDSLIFEALLKLSIDFDFDFDYISILRFLSKQHDGSQSEKRGAVEAFHEAAFKR
jgi:hypothetical protein